MKVDKSHLCKYRKKQNSLSGFLVGSKKFKDKSLSHQLKLVKLKRVTVSLKRLKWNDLMKKEFGRKYKIVRPCICRLSRQLLNIEIRRKKQQKFKFLKSFVSTNQDLYKDPVNRLKAGYKPSIYRNNYVTGKNAVSSLKADRQLEGLLQNSDTLEPLRKKIKQENKERREDNLFLGFGSDACVKGHTIKLKTISLKCSSQRFSSNKASSISIVTKGGIHSIATKTVGIPKPNSSSVNSTKNGDEESCVEMVLNDHNSLLEDHTLNKENSSNSYVANDVSNNLECVSDNDVCTTKSTEVKPNNFNCISDNYVSSVQSTDVNLPTLSEIPLQPLETCLKSTESNIKDKDSPHNSPESSVTSSSETVIPRETKTNVNRIDTHKQDAAVLSDSSSSDCVVFSSDKSDGKRLVHRSRDKSCPPITVLDDNNLSDCEMLSVNEHNYNKSVFTKCKTTKDPKPLTKRPIDNCRVQTANVRRNSETDTDTASEFSDSSVSSLSNSSEDEEEDEEKLPEVDMSEFLACDVQTGESGSKEELPNELPTYLTQSCQLKCRPHVELELVTAKTVTSTFCYLNNINGMSGYLLKNMLSKLTHMPRENYRYACETIKKEKEIDIPHFLKLEDPFVHSLFAKIIKADRKRMPRMTLSKLISRAMDFLNNSNYVKPAPASKKFVRAPQVAYQYKLPSNHLPPGYRFMQPVTSVPGTYTSTSHLNFTPVSYSFPSNFRPTTVIRPQSSMPFISHNAQAGGNFILVRQNVALPQQIQTSRGTLIIRPPTQSSFLPQPAHIHAQQNSMQTYPQKPPLHRQNNVYGNTQNHILPQQNSVLVNTQNSLLPQQKGVLVNMQSSLPPQQNSVLVNPQSSLLPLQNSLAAHMQNTLGSQLNFRQHPSNHVTPPIQNNVQHQQTLLQFKQHISKPPIDGGTYHSGQLFYNQRQIQNPAPPPLTPCTSFGRVPAVGPFSMAQPPQLKLMKPCQSEPIDLTENSSKSQPADEDPSINHLSLFELHSMVRHVMDYLKVFITMGFQKKETFLLNIVYQMLYANGKVCCSSHALVAVNQFGILQKLSFGMYTGFQQITFVELPLPAPPDTGLQTLEMPGHDLFIVKRFLFAIDKTTRTVLYPLPPYCVPKESDVVDKITVVILISLRRGLGPGLIVFPHSLLSRGLLLSLESNADSSIAKEWMLSAHLRGGLTQSMLLEYLNEATCWVKESRGFEKSLFAVDWWWNMEKEFLNHAFKSLHLFQLQEFYSMHKDPLQFCIGVTLERTWGCLVRQFTKSVGPLTEQNFPKFIVKVFNDLCVPAQLNSWCSAAGLYPVNLNKVQLYKENLEQD